VLDGFQGGNVAGRLRVSDREALVIDGGLGEDHAELDLPGMCLPVGAFALSARGIARYRGYPGAIDCYVQLGDWGGRAEGHHLSGCDSGCVDVDCRGLRLAVSFCTAFDPLCGKLHPSELSQ
jgi:hypothetical protein